MLETYRRQIEALEEALALADKRVRNGAQLDPALRNTSCGYVASRLENGRYEYLLVRTHSGEWGFPKGHMKAGETERQTAFREVREETGVYVSPIPGSHFREEITYPLPDRPGEIKRVVYFLGRSVLDEIVCQEEEVAEAGFFVYEEARARLSFADTREILRKASLEMQGGMIGAFRRNTELLKKLGITPLLYGSLGLQERLEKAIDVDDVDVLIPAVHLQQGWDAFRQALEQADYILLDEHEHTFERDGVCFSYAPVEELEDFAGIREEDVELISGRDPAYRLLSLRQYLRVYEASAKDGYRAQVRGKKDGEKITLIRRMLAREQYDMERFKQAHLKDYLRARKEIMQGQKITHWIWYIFPQLAGLGRSAMAQQYALRDLEEARMFLDDGYLGGHLREITQVLLDLGSRDAERVMGSTIDALKLRSSMTLFERAAEDGQLFAEVLERYFDGRRDKRTLQLLAEQEEMHDAGGDGGVL